VTLAITIAIFISVTYHLAVLLEGFDGTLKNEYPLRLIIKMYKYRINLEQKIAIIVSCIIRSQEN